MIITSIRGGLGNRLFQYAIGRSAALKNSVELKLDQLDFQEYIYHSGFRLYNFNITAQSATLKEINSLGTRNRIVRKLAREGIYHYKKSSFCVEKRVEESKFRPDILKKRDLYLRGYWQNENYFSDIRNVLLNDLILRDQLSVEASAILQEIKNTNSVAVHIRKSDPIGVDGKTGSDQWQPNSSGGLDMEYYRNAVKFISARLTNPTFFIFSNNIKWCEENLNELGLSNARLIDRTNSELEDFELMRNARHNIVANSTFSWWAAWFNTFEDKIVIAPKIWLDNWREHDPIPNSWERI
ncbi:alpha-1,2-fucosyltransferase [Campylobacterota bacterium]|nr:alpha-1,2-fucosyltransferase [Campylobacterota bacterium]